MKVLQVFAVFFLLHGLGWGAAHFYQQQHQRTVLLVVDTSFAMKPKFSAIQEWIERFEARTRYKIIMVGTDKARLGALSELKSKQVIFRTAFGSMNAESLARYAGESAERKILLSDGTLKPPGWEVVAF